MAPALSRPGQAAPVPYAPAAILLHWLGALLVGAAFVLGLAMVDIPGLSPTKLKYFSWHKWIGLTVLLSVAPRLLWRRYRPVPVAAAPRWQQRAAHLAHGALYALLIGVPLSGLLYSQAAGVPVVYLGVWQVPALVAPDPGWKATLKSVHGWSNTTLLCLAGLHVLAALKHQFIDRDNLLARMLPFLARRR